MTTSHSINGLTAVAYANGDGQPRIRINESVFSPEQLLEFVDWAARDAKRHAEEQAKPQHTDEDGDKIHARYEGGGEVILSITMSEVGYDPQVLFADKRAWREFAAKVERLFDE